MLRQDSLDVTWVSPMTPARPVGLEAHVAIASAAPVT